MKDQTETVLRALHDRKSVRVFTKEPVSAVDRLTILEAALQAPTAGNQVLYTILEIEDRKLKETLAESCDHQPFIATAPLVLIFLADCRRWLDCYREAGEPARNPGPGDLMLACSDALIAAQNVVTAAQALGLGSCYIGDIMENCEFHRKLLHLDPLVFPAAMLVIGHPTEQQKNQRKVKRFNLEYIVRKDSYSPLTGGELRAMFTRLRPEENFQFDDYLARFCRRKYMSGFALELNRSVGKYLEAFPVPEIPEGLPEFRP